MTTKTLIVIRLKYTGFKVLLCVSLESPHDPLSDLDYTFYGEKRVGELSRSEVENEF